MRPTTSVPSTRPGRHRGPRRTVTRRPGVLPAVVATIIAALVAAAVAVAGLEAADTTPARPLPQAAVVPVAVDGQLHRVRVPRPTRSAVRSAVTARYPHARVQVHRTGSTVAARVATPDLVFVRVAGTTRRVRTHEVTAAGILSQAGVRVGARDLVALRPAPEPGAEKESGSVGPGDGAVVEVTRVRRDVFTRRVRVPAPVRTRSSGALYVGQRRVQHPGRPGARVVRTVTVTHDGTPVRVRRDVVDRVAPRPRVVVVGTTPLPAPTATTRPGATRTLDPGPWPAVAGGAESRNWAALAHCEASGNPRAVNPAGYYGLYQFDTSTWASVGGTGLPHDASPAEQTYRAKRLYASRGAQPWPVCGRLL